MLRHSRLVSIVAVFVLLSLALFCSGGSAVAGLFVEALPRTEILRDGKLHIYLVGTGNPETEMQRVRKPSCVAIVYDGNVLFIDAGEGAVQTAACLGLPYERLSKVFMTHWHSDHFGGLGQLLNASWLHGRKQAVDVYGPFGTKEVISGLNKAYMLDALFRASTVHGYLDPNDSIAVPHELECKSGVTPVYKDEKLEIGCFLVDHSPVVPAFGYILKYCGCKIVISGDTTVVASLEQNSKDADILISEAFSHHLALKEMSGQTSSHLVEDLSRYHADSLELTKLAERAHVKHLILTHLVPAIATTEEAKRSFVEGMPELYKGALNVANDGDEIRIEPIGTGGFKIDYPPASQPDIPVFPRPKSESPMG